MRVAYQGEPGAYSEDAVLQVFPDGEPMPCETVRLVFSRVTSGEAAFGVVPLENSQAGSVNQTYDLLLHTSLVSIVGEVVVPVDHALLGLPGARLEDIKRVYSHPQALAQSEEFLASLRVEVVPVHDTAGAARMVAEAGRSEEEPVQVRHGLIAACARRLEVEVPLRQSRGCRDCAHVGISVRRRQGLTSTREAVPYAEASAEVHSAIWRSF